MQLDSSRSSGICQPGIETAGSRFCSTVLRMFEYEHLKNHFKHFSKVSHDQPRRKTGRHGRHALTWSWKGANVKCLPSATNSDARTTRALEMSSGWASSVSTAQEKHEHACSDSTVWINLERLLKPCSDGTGKVEQWDQWDCHRNWVWGI